MAEDVEIKKVADLQEAARSVTLEKLMEFVEEYGNILSQGDKTGPKTGLYYIVEAVSGDKVNAQGEAIDQDGNKVELRDAKSQALGLAPLKEVVALKEEVKGLKEKFQEVAAERDALQKALEGLLEAAAPAPTKPAKEATPQPGLPTV
jgi:hypothetical protein